MFLIQMWILYLWVRPSAEGLPAPRVLNVRLIGLEKDRGRVEVQLEGDNRGKRAASVNRTEPKQTPLSSVRHLDKKAV